MRRRLLPIGTLIRVKDHKEKYLIVGEKIKKDENNTYDYMCVPYPYGYVEVMECFYCNDEDVEAYVLMGNINY